MSRFKLSKGKKLLRIIPTTFRSLSKHTITKTYNQISRQIRKSSASPLLHMLIPWSIMKLRNAMMRPSSARNTQSSPNLANVCFQTNPTAEASLDAHFPLYLCSSSLRILSSFLLCFSSFSASSFANSPSSLV